MKKTLITSLVIGATLLGTAGCSSATAPDATIQQEYVAPPEVVPAPEAALTGEELFITALRSQGNQIVDNTDDASLLKLGYSTCDVFAQGFTSTEVFTYFAQNSDGTETDSYYEFVGMMVGASVLSLCPEYTSQLG